MTKKGIIVGVGVIVALTAGVKYYGQKETAKPAPVLAPADTENMPTAALGQATDMTTPETALASLTNALTSGDPDATAQCFADSAPDKQAIVGAVSDPNHPFNTVLASIDKTQPIELAWQWESERGLEVGWTVTVKTAFQIDGFHEGKAFAAGDKCELGAVLIWVGDRWLVDNFL